VRRFRRLKCGRQQYTTSNKETAPIGRSGMGNVMGKKLDDGDYLVVSMIFGGEPLRRGGAGGRLSRRDRGGGESRPARRRVVLASGAACPHHHAREQGSDRPPPARGPTRRRRSRACVLRQRRLSPWRRGIRGQTRAAMDGKVSAQACADGRRQRLCRLEKRGAKMGFPRSAGSVWPGKGHDAFAAPGPWWI